MALLFSLPLLGVCTRLLHDLHRLFLDILEHLDTLGIAGRIDQVEVSTIKVGVQHDGRADVTETPRLFDVLGIGFHDRILSILPLQPSQSCLEIGRAEQDRQSSSCVASSGDSINRRMCSVMKLISTSPGVRRRSGAMVDIAKPLHPVGSTKMKGKDFFPPRSHELDDVVDGLLKLAVPRFDLRIRHLTREVLQLCICRPVFLQKKHRSFRFRPFSESD